LGVSNVHPNTNLGKQRVTHVSAVLLWVLYQDTAAGGDGDGGDGVGADDGETKSAQVTEEVICVLVATVAYIHDYTDDGDGNPLSLTCSNHQWKQICTAPTSYNRNGAVQRRDASFSNQYEGETDWNRAHSSLSPLRTEYCHVLLGIAKYPKSPEHNHTVPASRCHNPTTNTADVSILRFATK